MFAETIVARRGADVYEVLVWTCGLLPGHGWRNERFQEGNQVPLFTNGKVVEGLCSQSAFSAMSIDRFSDRRGSSIM